MYSNPSITIIENPNPREEATDGEKYLKNIFLILFLLIPIKEF